MNQSAPPPNKRWLFTGAGGRVGRMLWRHWQQEPPSADLIRQTRNAARDFSHDTGKDGDNILVWDPLSQALPAETGRIDCVVAYAGITPAYGMDLGLNAALAEASLSAAFEAGASRVLLTSSSAIYGVPPGDAGIREDDTPHPVNDYGRSKLMMEAVCDPWRERGLEICCLRIGNVAGADVLLLNGLAASRAPLRIDRFSDGAGPLRSYIGPATLARVTAALASNEGSLPPSLNIGAPGAVAMSDLATAAGFPWVWQDAPPSAHQRITLDLSRLEALYSFAPKDSDPREMIAQWARLKDPQ